MWLRTKIFYFSEQACDFEMSRRTDDDFEEGEEVEEEKELENEDEENDDDDDEESSEEEEEEEDEDEEDVTVLEKPKGGQGSERLQRNERVDKVISEEINPVVPVRSKIGGKEPRRDLDKILAQRIVENFNVIIPKLEPKVEGWKDVLDSEWGNDNEHMFEERRASCQMANKDGAVHMIAYFCSILNTDPS